MDTIRTYTGLGVAVAGALALLVLAPMALQAREVEVRTGFRGTICTADAMQCPDGSWVGRSGPNCEFKCPGSTTTVRETFSVSPKVGEAPLEVRFASVLAEPERYEIAFGDGATSTYKVCAKSYPAQCSISHTYTAEGTYHATLTKDPCPPGAACFAASPIMGKATIVVRDHNDNNGNDNDDDDNNDHPRGGWGAHASSTVDWHRGWFNWFSNFQFKFWPFWK